ncbi:hypothetical protein L7F22_043103 [Adiantum nelumboides]|nr:hypothetical protein [Adiantum nelumboides]
MGSLMAGWNSPTRPNSKQGAYARSSSFTKYEIEEFKNRQKFAKEEHLKAAALLAAELAQAHQDGMKVDQLKKGVQLADGEPSSVPVWVEEELERLNSFKDWWTKSSWAFLNDSAMKRMDATNYKYKSQFHVAAPAASPPKSQ